MEQQTQQTQQIKRLPARETPGAGRRLAYLCLSFFLPVLIMTLGMAALGIAPFGNHSLAISDGTNYLNGMNGSSWLLNALLGKSDLFYSYTAGPGNNSWAGLAWGGVYLSHFLSLLSTVDTAVEWFSWICVCNLALCGLSMYLLLSGLRGAKPAHLIFSTSYALCGFCVVYCYHSLFFIGPQMLPLMALGLVRLTEGKAPFLYLLSLSFCILLNFYFGFILCVASLVIFLARLFGCEDMQGRRIRLFRTYALSSLSAGLLPAFLWLPALKAYSGGGRLDQVSSSQFRFSENMPFLQIFSKLFTGAISTDQLVDGLPNIFCGILVTALVILYFMNRRIPARRRRAAALVLIFYLLTFYITAFTTAMHGFTHTNWFPYRYSFVFSFFLILLAAEQFPYLRELTLAETKRCGLVLLGAVLLVFGSKYEYVSGGAVLLDLALLLVMWLGWYSDRRKPGAAPEGTLSLLLVVVSFNLYANFCISIRSLRDWEADREAYLEAVMQNGPLVEYAKADAEDGAFYRMENEYSRNGSSSTDSGLYGYNSLGFYGPTMRMFIHRGLCRLGLNWYDMRHWYGNGVPAATDALLGLRYVISTRDLSAEKGYSVLAQLGDSALYENPDRLGIAILANAEAQSVTLGSNVFENLNAVWKAMTGGEADVFTLIEDVDFTYYSEMNDKTVTAGELRQIRETWQEDAAEQSAAAAGQESAETEEELPASRIEYRLTAPQDGPVYLCDSSLPVSENGVEVDSVRSAGYGRAGEELTAYIPIVQHYLTTELFRNYCANMFAASADPETLSAYSAILNGRDLTLTRVRNSLLTGSFTAEEDRCLLFTIPWDEGWTCYIDGQRAELEKTWDLFLSVSVPAGSHSYELRFVPAWMDYGLAVSGAAFALLLALAGVWAVRSRRRASAEVPVPQDTPAEG